MSLDADQIQALLERDPQQSVPSRHRRTRDLDFPVGLTWAWGLYTDYDPHGQKHARDIANSRALEKWLGGKDEWDDDWGMEAGSIYFRLLGPDGQPTALANEVGPALLGLEDYPILDDDATHEVEYEYFDELWDREIIGEIGNEGKIHNWRGNWVLDFDEVEEDDLPDDWEEKLFDRYRTQVTETWYDDHGYAIPNLDAVAEAVDYLGLLATEEIDRDEAEVALDTVLARGEYDGGDWGLRLLYGRVVVASGEVPHPVLAVVQDRHVPYSMARTPFR